VLITSALFNIDARWQNKFWGPLGYLPDPSLGMSSPQKSEANKMGSDNKKGKGYDACNLHCCLEVMLSDDLKALQDGTDTRMNGMHLKLMGKSG
jgi:hypothetical protein